ncbi:hypothetical protein F4Y93_00560 [Candidatus Poribacteria bacterium]|nr:hypothetical protein [Candidatus Poribacteria bacterium]
MKHLCGLLCILTWGLLYLHICSVFAEAPKTAKIAFSSNRDGSSQIYSMNPDGSDQVSLTKHHSSNVYPKWSPTGEEILFLSNRDGLPDLYIMEADGKNIRKVFKKNEVRVRPDWSPDGKQIVYASGGFIYIADRDGENIQKVTQGKTSAWSPNGNWIAFISDPPPVQIWLLDLRTRDLEMIYQIGGGRLEDVSWSPDSDQLAFSGLESNFWDRVTIYKVNRDGSGIKRLLKTVPPFRAEDVTWSPDGDEMLYDQVAPGQSQIFKIDVEGRRESQLTQAKGFNSAPDWFDPEALPVESNAELLTTLWGKLKQK